MTIRILQFHEERTLIAGAQTAIGKVFIWIAGIALLILHDVSVLMLVSFTLVLLLPDRRRSLLMLVAFGLIVVKLLPEQFFELPTLLESVESITTTQWLRFLLSTAASTIAILGIIFAAIRLDQLPAIVRRHPLLILHLLVLFALALSSVLQLQVFASATFVLWRASFLLKAAAGGKTANTCLKDHLFYMVPVFGGSNTPFGKGPEYLSRYEATDPESIARSQLAGIKAARPRHGLDACARPDGCRRIRQHRHDPGDIACIVVVESAVHGRPDAVRHESGVRNRLDECLSGTG